jgi:WD40 repeat protein
MINTNTHQQLAHQIAPQSDATSNKLPIPAGTVSSLLQKFHSELLPQVTLHFENAQTIPVEVWLIILPFLATKQGIAPLRLVSTAFKMYVDHPIFAALPYAELDYSSPLTNKIRSFHSPFSSRPYNVAATSSSNLVAIGCLAHVHDLYHVGLKPFEKNESSNNETQVEFVRSFQEEFAPLEVDESIDFVIELKKNIFVSSSDDRVLRVLDLEKHECKVLQEDSPSARAVFKLSDFLFASTSHDSDSIMIWDVEKGKKIIEINAVAEEIKSINKLPQENLCLILSEDGITRLDITTEKSAVIIDQITWRDIETEEEKTISIRDSLSIHLLSDNKLALCWDKHLIITTIDNIFHGIELNSKNSQYITYPNRLFTRVCALPNDYIACIAHYDNLQEGGSFMIYDLNQKIFIFDYYLKEDNLCELLLLADQRILICSNNEIYIFPFAVKTGH